MPTNMHPIARHMVAIVNQLLGQGFHFPIHLAAIAVNGSMISGSFTGEKFETSAQESFDDGYRLPINMMFVDGVTGDAARVLIQNPDQEEYAIN
jgi:hypothetical protein